MCREFIPRRTCHGATTAGRRNRGLPIELDARLLAAHGAYRWSTPLAAALIASVSVVAASSLAFTGPGALSLDDAVGFAPEGVAWGLGAFVVAVLGALGQLAQRPLVSAATPVPAEQATAATHAG